MSAESRADGRAPVAATVAQDTPTLIRDGDMTLLTDPNFLRRRCCILAHAAAGRENEKRGPLPRVRFVDRGQTVDLALDDTGATRTTLVKEDSS